MTSGQRKFAEGVATGLSNGEAYARAFPRSRHPAEDASRLLSARNPKRSEVLAEIQRIRAAAEALGGSAVLTLLERRMFLARLVRARLAEVPESSDLWQEVTVTETGTKRKLGDKLKAITIDNDLAGDGSEAKANDGIGSVAELMLKIRGSRWGG